MKPSAMPSRRMLKFPTYDAALAELELLRRTPHDEAGRWNLPQISRHLADTIRYSLDGFPPLPWTMRLMIPLGRALILRGALRRIDGELPIPTGIPAPKLLQPLRADAFAIDDLRAQLQRLQTFTGHFHPSPLLGELSTERWHKMHRLHAAHHLGFLVPRK